MSRKEWAIGNSGEICAGCHKPITQICGCGSNDIKFKNLFKQIADLTIENTALKNRINEYEGINDQFNWQSEQDAQAIYERDQELAQLTGLLREMVKAGKQLLMGHDQLYDAFFHYLPDRNPENDLAAADMREVLKHPEIKKILEEEDKLIGPLAPDLRAALGEKP